jgi:hypothetical protein
MAHLLFTIALEVLLSFLLDIFAQLTVSFLPRAQKLFFFEVCTTTVLLKISQLSNEMALTAMTLAMTPVTPQF